MLRYDALGTGHAALVVINLGAAQATVQLRLGGLPPQLLGQHPTNLCKSLAKCSVAAPVLSNHTSISVARPAQKPLFHVSLCDSSRS